MSSRGWGRCFKVTLQACAPRGLSGGSSVHNPGVRTPIGASGNYGFIIKILFAVFPLRILIPTRIGKKLGKAGI
jgi:hypothetical protein